MSWSRLSNTLRIRPSPMALGWVDAGGPSRGAWTTLGGLPRPRYRGSSSTWSTRVKISSAI
eukprot:9002409-Pyramimonas_sp.AAC.1